VSRSANTCKADDMTTFCRVILGKPLVVNDGFYICIIINMYIYIYDYICNVMWLIVFCVCQKWSNIALNVLDYYYTVLYTIDC
jgi:hypothetical protein